MGSSMLSPGVYVSEEDYSEYTQDSSSCIVGIVGGARRGPVGTPVLITTQEQLINTFGIPIEGEYGIYSALQVLTHANRVYYVRAVRSGTKASAGTIGKDRVIYYSKEANASYNGIQIVQTELREDGTFDVTIQKDDSNVLENYYNLNLDQLTENYIEKIINNQSNYVTAVVQYSGNITAKTFTLGSTPETEGKGSGSYAYAGKESEDKIVLRSKYYDSDINGCTAIISEERSYPNSQYDTSDRTSYFSIIIQDTAGNVIENWANLSLDPSSDRYAEIVINNSSDRVICYVNKSEDITFEAKTLSFSGGDDGVDGLSASDIIGDVDSTGLQVFSNPETITVDIIITPGWYDVNVIQAATNICESREECMYLVDPPKGLSPQEVVQWSNGVEPFTQENFNGLNSSYSALYWPWESVYDSYTKKDIWLPPSGFVAAQYAYNDEIGHPWQAPAGLNRGRLTTVKAVEISPTKGERDELYGYRNVVNPIVNFVSNGIVIWGQKTTQRNPTALDRVNVRRLMNYLKRNIGNSTRNFVFEQNIDATWDRWRSAVEPILVNTKNNQGLYEYKIVNTLTESDIENNRATIKIYVKPTKSAEFIDLKFNITQYSASYDDIV